MFVGVVALRYQLHTTLSVTSSQRTLTMFVGVVALCYQQHTTLSVTISDVPGSILLHMLIFRTVEESVLTV